MGKKHHLLQSRQVPETRSLPAGRWQLETRCLPAGRWQWKLKRKLEALEERTATTPMHPGGGDCRLRTQRAAFSPSGYS